MACHGLCRFHRAQLENLYWWQVGKALLSPDLFKGEDGFFSWGKAGTPADLCGFTPVKQLVQGSHLQSAPNSFLPSGTGSAPSQREGCHLQHCAQCFLQHHGSPWTSPSEEIIRASPLKWRLDNSSMTEMEDDDVLKLVSYFRNTEVVSNRFLAFIFLVSYCHSVRISSSTTPAC